MNTLQKSFKWVMQMSQTKHSPRTRLFERIPKVLCGSVSGDGSRAAEYGRALVREKYLATTLVYTVQHAHADKMMYAWLCLGD